MDQSGSILVALDASEATDRAIAYVAKMVGGRPAYEVHLLHVLPPMPPALLEWGGSEDPELEKKGEAELEAAQTRWVRQADEAARPIYEKAMATLRKSGVPAESIHAHSYVTYRGQDVARDSLEVAREKKCDTVVVGRESFPWYRELFHHHTAPELVRKGHGLTIWIVE